MKALITRYALSTGIFSVECEVCEGVDSTMIAAKSGGYTVHYHGKDWHRTEAEAVAQAEVMRTKKLSSLKKQIEKIEALTFKVSEDMLNDSR